MRVAGYLSEIGTVSIAGAPARMTTATNFESEVIVGVGTYSIPVTATDVSGNSGSVTNTRTFTANGLSTTLAYDLSGNQTLKSNATSVLTFGWDGANGDNYIGHHCRRPGTDDRRSMTNRSVRVPSHIRARPK